MRAITRLTASHRRSACGARLSAIRVGPARSGAVGEALGPRSLHTGRWPVAVTSPMLSVVVTSVRGQAAWMGRRKRRRDDKRGGKQQKTHTDPSPKGCVSINLS